MRDLYKNILNEVTEEHKTNHLRERNSRVMIVDGLNTFINLKLKYPSVEIIVISGQHPAERISQEK